MLPGTDPQPGEERARRQRLGVDECLARVVTIEQDEEQRHDQDQRTEHRVGEPERVGEPPRGDDTDGEADRRADAEHRARDATTAARIAGRDHGGERSLHRVQRHLEHDPEDRDPDDRCQGTDADQEEPSDGPADRDPGRTPAHA